MRVTIAWVGPIIARDNLEAAKVVPLVAEVVLVKT